MNSATVACEMVVRASASARAWRRSVARRWTTCTVFSVSPSVLKELSKIFEETLGTEVVPMTAADRSKLSAELREMAKAVR